MARGPSEVLLLGSADGSVGFDYDGRYEALRSIDGRQRIVLDYWNPDTLDYEIATSGGSEPGANVAVTNFPSTQVVSDGGNSLTVDEERANTGTVSSVSGSVSSVTLLAANANRIGLRVYNDSSATLYLKFGSSATTSSYTKKLFPESFLEDYQYTGLVAGIWDSAAGAARVTELT
jgi:hypothetical protein